MAGNTSLVLFRRLFRQARPYWPHLGALFIVSVLGSPLALLAPLPLKIIVDSLIGTRPLPRFLDRLVPDSISGSPTALAALAIGLLVGVALLGQLQRLTRTGLRAYIEQRVAAEFRVRFFRRARHDLLARRDAGRAQESPRPIGRDGAAVAYALTE